MNVIKKIIVAAILAFFVTLPCRAFEIPDSTVSYAVEFNSSVSTGETTPFWLVANR